MRELIESGTLTEINNLQNVGYILNDNDKFFLTGYKVLQGQENNGFIKCAKLKYNGKIKLLYMTSEYKSFSGLIPSLDSNRIIIIIEKLLNSIIEVKNNGFLNCLNIDISLDKIFVDSDTLKTYLIYIPLNTLSDDTTIFEKKLRTNLISAIHSLDSLNLENLSKICEELDNDTISLEDLYNIIQNEHKDSNNTIQRDDNEIESKKLLHKGEKSFEFKKLLHKDTVSIQPQLLLSSIQNPTTTFYISKPEFIIGKNPSVVDGVITFNNAISRIHCKIVFKKRKYYVIDLGSANGTYLNAKRIIDNKPTILNDGDILKLANSEFKISI